MHVARRRSGTADCGSAPYTGSTTKCGIARAGSAAGWLATAAIALCYLVEPIPETPTIRRSPPRHAGRHDQSAGKLSGGDGLPAARAAIFRAWTPRPRIAAALCPDRRARADRSGRVGAVAERPRIPRNPNNAWAPVSGKGASDSGHAPACHVLRLRAVRKPQRDFARDLPRRR